MRIRQPQDAAAWRQFAQTYAPLVYGHLRKRGLQDADAADVAQDVLRTVAARIGQFEYDPARGSFRGWLLAVVHSRLADFRRHGQREQALLPLERALTLARPGGFCALVYRAWRTHAGTSAARRRQHGGAAGRLAARHLCRGIRPARLQDRATRRSATHLRFHRDL
ncbi:MAG: hypothetical protein HC774_06505 [Sphingomonadales bacterium]|nr:hypothetical protein [Sphingomonadales bacterium]